MTTNVRAKPTAKAEMLIRKPVSEVFEAMVDPAITSKFWFTKSTGRLDEHDHVRWDWEMYDVSAEVDVQTIEKDSRIVINWPTRVEWVFTPRDDKTTFVSVTDSGFEGDFDEAAAQAVASTEGFSFLLASLKAYLEHGIVLGLVPDRHPDGFPG